MLHLTIDFCNMLFSLDLFSPVMVIGDIVLRKLFLKVYCTKSGKLQILPYSSFLCVLHFSVSVVSLFSSYI